MKIIKTFVFLLILPSSLALAEPSIGNDCKPSGVFAKLNERINPQKFWTNQIEEIKVYVNNSKLTYRLNRLDERRARAEEKFDDQEMRVLGIKQYSNSEMDRLLADTDSMIRGLERDMLNRAISWGKKCTAYSLNRLEEEKKR